jgi:hypothetical protein
MKVMTERRPERRPAGTPPLEAPKPKPPAAGLMKIVTGDADFMTGLMFWMVRHQYPDFSIMVTEADIEKFRKSLEATEQTPVFDPFARDTFIVLRVVDQKGEPIQPLESTEEDARERDAATKLRRIKEQAPQIVQNVMGELSQGITSDDSIRTLCNNLLALARA